MIKDEELLVLKNVVNPEMVREILSIDNHLERIGETEHHTALSLIINSNETNLVDMGYQIQELFRSEVKRIITSLGVKLNKDVTLNVDELEDVLESMLIMFEPGNADLFENTMDSYQDGQDFICQILEQTSSRTYIYWLTHIDDFDIGSLSMIKRELELPLTEAEVADIAENEMFVRKYAASLPNRDDINYVLTFLTNREMSVKFGYSFNVGMVAVDEGLDYLLQARLYDRLLHELTLLALGSSLPLEEVKVAISNFLEDNYIDPFKRLELIATLEKRLEQFYD